MFGDTLILEESNAKLDNKRRIVIPKFTGVSENDKLAFFYTADFKGLKVYHLSTVKESLLTLANMIQDDIPFQKYILVKKDIENIELYSAGYAKVDQQGRIVLPECACQRLNLTKDKSSIFIAGTLDSIEIYPNQETYIASKTQRINNSSKQLNTFLKFYKGLKK